MIVKIQRPVEPPNGDLLIYNQRRDFMVTRPPTEAVLKLMGDKLKIYADATIKPGELIVLRVRTDQDW